MIKKKKSTDKDNYSPVVNRWFDQQLVFYTVSSPLTVANYITEAP